MEKCKGIHIYISYREVVKFWKIVNQVNLGLKMLYQHASIVEFDPGDILIQK